LNFYGSQGFITLYTKATIGTQKFRPTPKTFLRFRNMMGLYVKGINVTPNVQVLRGCIQKFPD